MRWQSGNDIQLLRSGAEYFPALLQAIRQARHEIFLESYLYEPDATGRRVSAGLIRAARRGVRVHILLDGFGARDLPPSLKHSMARAGVKLLFFRPELRLLSLDSHRLRRLHRKLVCIDGELGFVGGINIIDDLNDPGAQIPRYDYALQVRGPICTSIRQTLIQQWRHSCWVQLKHGWAKVTRLNPSLPKQGKRIARLLTRDNFRHRREIEHAYLNAIRRAKSEIIIANAYLLPGLSLRRALVEAAKRGVDVRIVVQGQIDQALLHYAARSLYRPALAAGISIYEYMPGFMHAKVAVVDGRWLTVGSSNIDPLSLLAAREANLEVLNSQLAQALRADLLAHIASDCQQVLPAKIAKLPWWRQLLPWLAYQLVRMLLGLTGYGREEYRA